MHYYAYKGQHELGKEPLGTEGRMLIVKTTDKAAKKTAKKVLGPDFRLYAYTNFYNDKTFREIT